MLVWSENYNSYCKVVYSNLDMYVIEAHTSLNIVDASFGSIF